MALLPTNPRDFQLVTQSNSAQTGSTPVDPARSIVKEGECLKYIIDRDMNPC